MRFFPVLICFVFLAFPIVVADAVETGEFTPPQNAGSVSVLSDPDAATVELDGGIAGATPIVLILSAGTEHEISVIKDGYQRVTRILTVEPGELREIAVTLPPQLVQVPENGTVQVVSIPPGAVATLDEIYGGTTPVTFADVPLGEHIIEVSMAGYRNWVKRVTVEGGKAIYIDAVLAEAPPEAGILRISSSPAGADIYIDGLYGGFTPKTIGNLAPGLHTVRLILAGDQEWTGEVAILPGEMTNIAPLLTPNTKPNTGSIFIKSRPIGAAIYLDGNFIGITYEGDGFDITNVIPGTHKVTLKLKGYQDYTVSIDVPADRVVKLEPRLAFNQIPHPSGQVQISSVPEGAEVFFDRQFKGFTPLTLQDIEVGQHDVRLKMAGMQDYHDIIRVTAYQTALVNGVLEPVTPVPTRAGIPPVLAAASLILSGMAWRVLQKRKQG